MPPSPSRRRFLARAGLGIAAAGASRGLGLLLGDDGKARASSDLARKAPVGRHWLSLERADGDCAACHAGAGKLDLSHAHPPGIVKCFLCSHECEIRVGERGRCRVRENVGGEIRTLVYGRPSAIHLDPIEKKPFYHFLPGSVAYSLGTAGCPLRCRFCQNWRLSQANPEEIEVVEATPGSIVRAARRAEAPVIAFTYNEPTVFFEYLTDIVERGKPEGLRHVMISCGFTNVRPLAELCGVLDAIKVDLKGYDEEFYRQVCSAQLKPVLRTIRTVRERGVHLEIVNLVVPTLNDSEKSLRNLAAWVAGELGPDVPVHFTRFHPDYRLMHLPGTPVATLERAREIALAEGLHFPYVGNVPGHPGNHTYCPGCGEIVIERSGFHVGRVRIEEGSCESCGTPVAGVWI